MTDIYLKPELFRQSYIGELLRYKIDIAMRGRILRAQSSSGYYNGALYIRALCLHGAFAAAILKHISGSAPIMISSIHNFSLYGSRLHCFYAVAFLPEVEWLFFLFRGSIFYLPPVSSRF